MNENKKSMLKNIMGDENCATHRCMLIMSVLTSRISPPSSSSSSSMLVSLLHHRSAKELHFGKHPRRIVEAVDAPQKFQNNKMKCIIITPTGV